jgi:hypothetical protein
MSFKPTTQSNNGRQIKRPTLYPHTYTRWFKEYVIEAVRDFGDAGEALKTGKHPVWRKSAYTDHLLATTDETEETLQNKKGIQKEEFKIRMKQFVDRQAAYERNLVMLYADGLQHLSIESMNLLTKDGKIFAECEEKQDPLTLISVLQTSHSQVGRTVSDEELRMKKKELESLKQWDSRGNVASLEDHDRAWRDLHEEAVHLGVEWDEKELIKIYLSSVDSTHISHDLSAILKPNATDFPKSVVEASFWVASTVHLNKLINQSRPGAKRSAKEPTSHHAYEDTSGKTLGTNTHPECLFCKKHHVGGAQKCTRLITLMKDKPDIVANYTKMQPKHHNNKFKGNNKASEKKRKPPGTSRKGKANARKWSAREEADDPNKHSNVSSTEGDESMKADDIKEFMTRVLKASKLGEYNFHYRVTPVDSYATSRVADKKRDYMLDNGSNCNVMGNRELVWNIQTIEPTVINGMGSVTVTEQAECLFGPCLVADNMAFNIIAESEVMKRYSLKLDSNQSPHYIVGGDILWRRSDFGLLWLSHDDASLLRYRAGMKVVNSILPLVADKYTLAADVNADVRHYSADERTRAKAVHRIHEILGHPNDAALGILLDSGCVHGSPYTSRDVRAMRKIYGPCVSCIKGKTTAPTDGRVVNKWLATAPGERLCMDIYFLTVMSRMGKYTTIPILIVVDDYTGYLQVVTLPSKTTEAVREAVFDVIAFYNFYDFAVKEIRSDRENVFLSLQPSLSRHPQKVVLDAIGTDQHEKKAERAIRTLRDALRTVKAGSWYKMPQFLYPYLTADLAAFKNCIPNRKTVNRTPRDIVEGRKITQDQHLRVPLGLVGEFRVPHGTHANTTQGEQEQLKNENRTATGIVVKRHLDSHGTLQVYLIDSGRFVNRAKLVVERTHTIDLRRQLERLAPVQAVPDDELLRICPRLTTSHKRQRPADAAATSRRGGIEAEIVEEIEETAETIEPPTDGVHSTTNSDPNEMVVSHPDDMDITLDSDPSEDDQSDLTHEGAPQNDITLEKQTGESDHNEHIDVPKKSKKAAKIARKRADKRHKTKEHVAAPPQEHRTSKRQNRARPQRFAHAASPHNMDIKKAKEKYPDHYHQSMVKELKQFHDKAVAKVIDAPVSGLKHSKIIGVNGFFKATHNIKTGAFEKLKFRLVPQGHLVDRAVYTYQETTSPTVAVETIFAAINIAAYENRRGFTMDIPGAYLNATLKDPHMVKFRGALADAYIALYPQYATRRQPDGSLLFLVTKAFYGLPESSARWYDDITNSFKELGYTVHPADGGLFVKEVGSDRSILLLWVDDILGWATNDELIMELKYQMEKKYGGCKLNTDDVLVYLGMTITQPNKGTIHVDQRAFIEEIIRSASIGDQVADTPYHPDLLKPATSTKKTVNSTEFASALMKAMYLGKRTRPDILTALSVLATRMQSADNRDIECLRTVQKYLNQTKQLGLTFHPTTMELTYWVDAAYGLHNDMRGHGGTMVTFGYANAPVYTKSSKQKLHTRSSTETELVALDDSFQHLLWFRQVVEFMGYKQNPAVMYQDNKSTIIVCESGHSKNGKLKHMAIRYYFIHGQLERNIAQLRYCKSADMIADLLTKPLAPQQFKKLRDKMLNRII